MLIQNKVGQWMTHIVTQEMTLLGERTIVGPRSVKDAVKFYDPENLRPEKIALTDGPITAVWSADMHHKKRLGEEEAEKKRKEAEEKLKAEEVDWSKRDQAALSLGSKVYS